MFRKCICILAMTALLQGCGATFVYNNLLMISPWYVDDYIDLDKDQDKLFQTQLATLHQWHRQHELPEYRRLLSELLAHLDADQLDPQFLATHLVEIRQRWTLLLDKATPALTELALTMSDQQVSQLTTALEKRNLERLEKADTPSEHRAERIESITEWMGVLTPEQTNWVSDYAARHPDQTEISVSAHRAFQLKLKVLLQQRTEPNFSTLFSELVANSLATPEGAVLTLSREQNLDARIELYRLLWSSASDQQKASVKSRLSNFIDDIDSLIAKDTVSKGA